MRIIRFRLLRSRPRGGADGALPAPLTGSEGVGHTSKGKEGNREVKRMGRKRKKGEGVGGGSGAPPDPLTGSEGVGHTSKGMEWNKK